MARSALDRLEHRPGLVPAAWLAALLALAVALEAGPADAGAARAEAESTAGRMVVDVKGDRLSVTLHDAALADTLRVIAARTGFRVVVNTSVDDRLSVAFGDLPLDQGLRRLLGGLNALFVYSPTGALEEVRLYPGAVGPPLARGALTPDEARARAPLGADEDPAGVPTSDHALRLRPQLGDPEPSQRLAAAVALGGTREAPRAVGVLLDLLSPHTEPGIREQALGALRFFDAVPVDPIAEIAMFDPQSSLQLEALEILIHLAGRDATAQLALLRVADIALDAAVRERAGALLQGLEGFPDQKGLPSPKKLRPGPARQLRDP